MASILPIPLEWFLLGAFGALCRYLFKQFRDDADWKIVLPSYKDGTLYLGILSYILLGGAAGWLAPHWIGNDVNSFLAGFFFITLFESLEQKKSTIVP